MSPLLILAGIWFTLLALMELFHRRLRGVVAERHPATLRTIDSMTRSLPRPQRAVERRSRYKMLLDPEIDRHIQKLDRLQYVGLSVWLAFAVTIIAIIVASAAHR